MQNLCVSQRVRYVPDKVFLDGRTGVIIRIITDIDTGESLFYDVTWDDGFIDLFDGNVYLREDLEAL